MALNGTATMNGPCLRLTDGDPGEYASAWYATKVNIQAFTQDFSFQLTNPQADGITFAIQNAGPTALGGGGGWLGYAPITRSVAVKFDLYNDAGEGVDSTGLYLNGAIPTVPAVDMMGSGVDLHSGDVFNVHMVYDGSTLTMQITDTSTQQSFVTSWTIDIPGTVGGTTAYVWLHRRYWGKSGHSGDLELGLRFAGGYQLLERFLSDWNGFQWQGKCERFVSAIDGWGPGRISERMVRREGECPGLHPGLQFPNDEPPR